MIARTRLFLQEEGQFLNLVFVVIALRLDDARHVGEQLDVEFGVNYFHDSDGAAHRLQATILLLESLALLLKSLERVHEL